MVSYHLTSRESSADDREAPLVRLALVLALSATDRRSAMTWRWLFRSPIYSIAISARRWVDAFWGYDVFIAHRRSDGATYALALHERLKEEGISSFIDQIVYGPGDYLAVATRRHVTKSTLLLLVGSPDVLVTRRPIDWIEEEIKTYLESHGDDPKIIVVDFGGTLSSAIDQWTNERVSLSPVVEQVQSFIRLPEELIGLSAPPSKQVVSAVQSKLAGRRRDRSRLWFFESVAATLFVLLLAASGMAWFAWTQKQVAQENLQTAQRNLERALETDSRRLAAESRRQLAAGHPDVAILLAREALSATVIGLGEVKRPYQAATAVALVRGMAERPLATDLWEFDIEVQFATVSPDEKSILVLTGDGFVEVRDRATGQRRRWRAHADTQHAGAFHPDGRIVATSSQDGSVKLWNAVGEQQEAYETNSAVRSVSFSKDGKLLVASSDDGFARVWRVGRKGPLRTFSCFPRMPKRSSDQNGRGINSHDLSVDGKRIVIGCVDGTAEVWDVVKPRRLAKFAGRSTASVWCVAFSPDGSVVAMGTDDGKLQIWNAHTGSLLHVINAHADRVQSAAFSTDGTRIVTASHDHSAAIWNTATGSRLITLSGHSKYVQSAKFVDADRGVITSSWDRTLRIWKLYNEEIQFTKRIGKGGIASVALSPLGHRIAVGTWKGGGAIVNAVDGTIIQNMQSGSAITSIAFDPTGRTLAIVTSADGDDTSVVNLWDVATSTQLVPFVKRDESVGPVSFSRDAKKLLLPSRNRAELWSANSAELLVRFPDQRDEIEYASFSPTRDEFITVSFDGSASLWDMNARAKRLDLPPANESLNAAVFDAVGERVVVCGQGGSLNTFSASSGELLVRFPRQESAVNYCEFSPDGKLIVAALADGTLILWESRSSQPVAAYHADLLATEEKGKGVVVARFSPDGERIVMGVDDGTVRTWVPKVRNYADLLAGALPSRSLSSRERREFGLD